MPERASDAKDALRSHVLTEPFVGNECVEDNLAECVKIAIWKAIGEASHNVRVTVVGGVARLDGVVRSDAQSLGAEGASLAIDPKLTRSRSWRRLLDEDQDPLACA